MFRVVEKVQHGIVVPCVYIFAVQVIDKIDNVSEKPTSYCQKSHCEVHLPNRRESDIKETVRV